MSRLLPISANAAELLRNPPGIGEGRHQWLFRVAACLHHSNYRPEKIRAFLEDVGTKYGWSDRMGKTLDDIFIKLESGLVPTDTTRLPPWPKKNHPAREARFNHNPMFDPDADTGLAAKDVIPQLFKQDEIMCVGWSKYKFTSMPVIDLLHTAHNAEFIVANPMTAEVAANGSKRNKTIASPPAGRRFAVIEFDTKETKQQQAAVLSSLHGPKTPLVMAVWSGGKSIHAWYNVKYLTPYEKLYFFRFAASIGADETLYDMSKLVRMPGGRRSSGQKQGIIYWEPEHL
jgi:hypothetical protein